MSELAPYVTVACALVLFFSVYGICDNLIRWKVARRAEEREHQIMLSTMKCAVLLERMYADDTFAELRDKYQEGGPGCN
jgi:hypothetical protein